MASYRLNRPGVAKAGAMIEAHQYDLESSWAEAQPSSDAENRKIDSDGWEGFGEWFLAVDADASPQTKDRYGFPFGDFRRVHKRGLEAAKQRAAQNGHAKVEEAADRLLELIERASA